MYLFFIIIINKFGFNGQESLKKGGEQNLWQGLLYICILYYTQFAW